MKQCHQCGAELPDDARFCMRCGTQQEQVPDAQAHVEGGGAAAQVGGVAASDHSVAVGGDVGGDITINELPPAVLKLFARQFGFDPDASDTGAELAL